MSEVQKDPREFLGQIVLTMGAQQELVPEDVSAALRSHAHGYWGENGVDKRSGKDRDLTEGLGVSSLHSDRNGTQFWTVTKADRSMTGVMLLDEW